MSITLLCLAVVLTVLTDARKKPLSITNRWLGTRPSARETNKQPNKHTARANGRLSQVSPEVEYHLNRPGSCGAVQDTVMARSARAQRALENFWVSCKG